MSQNSWRFAAALVIFLASLHASRAAEGEETAAPPTLREPGAVEATLADGSVLKLILADKEIEIATPHGKLRVPTEDVLRIEFAQRLPAEVAQLLDAKLGQLRDPDAAVQKQAASELLAMREAAYLTLIKAAKSGDPDLAPQAATVLAKLRKAVPRKVLDTVRDEDFIETPDSKVAGRIVPASLKVRTSQFGELSLKLADARRLRHQSLIPQGPVEDETEALPDPGNLKAYESQHGKVFAFTVTGAAGGGGLWGTGTYTTDSRLALAAVHAGVLKVGETGVVRVKMQPSPDSFAGSTQNGVTSSGYPRYSGAYEVLTKSADDE
ncbi:MAG: LCCL domain-containing protein [Pirellulaceae bacterium]|nr:LCCL domain-containing protein [Pirellulaceae bacterium]